MKVDVSNKSIIITGSSRGIGLMMAQHLINEGANVILNGINSEPPDFIHNNPKAIYVKADISRQMGINELCSQAQKTFGKIDVFINNAGVLKDRAAVFMSEEDWHKEIGINLSGVFLCIKKVAKIMIHQKQGKIINIASRYGQHAYKGYAAYSASKAGVIALTEALSQELFPTVTINAICPGRILTDLSQNSIDDKGNMFNKEHIEDLLNFITLLSSDKMQSISGQVFNLYAY